jgi:hypothetical protein
MLPEILIIVGLIVLALLLFCPIPIRLSFACSKGESFWKICLFRKKILSMKDFAEDGELNASENLLDSESDDGDDDDLDDKFVNASTSAEDKESLGAPEALDIDKEQCEENSGKENKSASEKNSEYTNNAKTKKEKKHCVKKRKKKLNEREFLTVLLEPKFDSKVISFLLRLMKSYYRLFRIRFEHTVVEGIQLEYNQMGVLQGAFGILTSNVKLFKNWDFRMDWCHDKKPRIEGTLVLYITGGRILVAVCKTIFYVGRIFLMYWKNKKQMLSNPGAFRLIFWRRWIVNFMTAEN